MRSGLALCRIRRPLFCLLSVVQQLPHDRAAEELPQWNVELRRSDIRHMPGILRDPHLNHLLHGLIMFHVWHLRQLIFRNYFRAILKSQSTRLRQVPTYRSTTWFYDMGHRLTEAARWPNYFTFSAINLVNSATRSRYFCRSLTALAITCGGTSRPVRGICFRASV